MRIKTLTMAALAWASLGLLSAGAKEIIILPEQPAQKPAAKGDAKSAAVANDPAEPPLKVEVSYGKDGNERLFEARGGRAVVRGGREAAAQAVTVASSARGTVLTL